MHDGLGPAASDDLAAHAMPPGSLRHFAVLYSGLQPATTLTAIYAFEKEIGDTVRASSHEVAHTRLQWWRAEVDRLLAGQPLHPVTRALQTLPPPALQDLALLHEALVAADIDMARITFARPAELEAYCFRASGALQTLAAHAAAGSRPLSDAERKFARALGSALRQTEMLRDVRQDVAQGRLYIPLERLEQAGIDPLQVRHDAASPALLAVLAAWRADVRAQLAALPALLTKAERATQRQGLVLAALYSELLDHIEHRAELARTRAEVPHWRRLWTAWRTAVRYR
jgi:15-cis-phytoene synthase